jgi:hypothetical protein
MSEHLKLQELLEVRDHGAGPVAVRHAEACAACAAELQRLREVAEAMASLPAATPDGDGWTRLLGELERRSRARRHRRLAFGALAAALLVAVALASLWQHRQLHLADRELAAVMAQSERLEQVWRAARPDARVMSAPEAARLAAFEHGIALVDVELARLPRDRQGRSEALRLWRTRVDLLGAATRGRTVRAAYLGF